MDPREGRGCPGADTRKQLWEHVSGLKSQQCAYVLPHRQADALGCFAGPAGTLAAAPTPSRACEEAASRFSALLRSWPQGVSPSPCGEALQTLGPPVDPLSLQPLLQELRSETAPEGLQTFLW